MDEECREPSPFAVWTTDEQEQDVCRAEPAGDGQASPAAGHDAEPSPGLAALGGEGQDLGPEGPTLADAVRGSGQARLAAGVVRDFGRGNPGPGVPAADLDPRYARNMRFLGENPAAGVPRGGDVVTDDLTAARNLVSVPMGLMRGARGVEQIADEARREDPRASRLVEGGRNMVAGAGWSMGAYHPGGSGALGTVASGLEMVEGALEYRENQGESVDADVAAAEHVVHGAGGLALGVANRPELSAAWDAGWELENQGSDFAARHELLGTNADGTPRSWGEWAGDQGLEARREAIEEGRSPALAEVEGALTTAVCTGIGTGGAAVTGIAEMATDAYEVASGERPLPEIPGSHPNRTRRIYLEAMAERRRANNTPVEDLILSPEEEERMSRSYHPTPTPLHVPTPEEEDAEQAEAIRHLAEVAAGG